MLLQASRNSILDKKTLIDERNYLSVSDEGIPITLQWMKIVAI